MLNKYIIIKYISKDMLNNNKKNYLRINVYSFTKYTS